MSAEHRTGSHHATAAEHHQQAMHYHRAASTHYQIGQDYAQRAIFHGNEAAKHHVEHYGGARPTAELA